MDIIEFDIFFRFPFRKSFHDLCFIKAHGERFEHCLIQRCVIVFVSVVGDK